MEELRFRWTGFRGFTKPTELRLPKFTLLIGKNNVGKSSAYAPLLLLKQTLDARSPETALLSRGPLIDAGPFRDYVSNHDPDGSVTLRAELGFSADTASSRKREKSIVSAVEATFQSDDGHTAFLSRHRLEDERGEAIVQRKRDKGQGAFTFTSPLLPSKLSSGRPTREITALRSGLRQEQPEGFLFSGLGALMIPRRFREDKDRWAKVQSWYNAGFELYEVQNDFNRKIVAFLRSISYVGPLRSLPQRTYRLAAEAPLEVGGAGEWAPELLFRLAQSEVSELVNEWLSKLEYGRLEFEQLSDEYFQVLLQPAGRTRVNLADTGVGLSQVIPLLVQSALAKPGSTVIAQQPEIHLNPAQQSIVTDILIDRAASGVRLVVESHSEHVLLRLRRRIAEQVLDPSEVAVYFVEPTQEGTSLRRVHLGDLGEISREEWPEGFFEDQLHDSFALAAAQSVRKRSGETR